MIKFTMPRDSTPEQVRDAIRDEVERRIKNATEQVVSLRRVGTAHSIAIDGIRDFLANLHFVEPEKPWLTRVEAAAYLKETYGIPCSTATLAKYACGHGVIEGPKYRRISNKATLYTREDLDEWAATRMKEGNTHARTIHQNAGQVQERGSVRQDRQAEGRSHLQFDAQTRHGPRNSKRKDAH